MRIRGPVAVLLSRFPLITETFVLREVIEMERRGQPLILVPLIRERPATVHPQAIPWLARALLTPFLSPAIVAANLRLFSRRPRIGLAVMGRVLLGVATSPNLLLRTMALLPKCVYLAERLREAGVRHLHAHFATHPATAAFVIAALTDATFSFTAHAHDIFVRRQLLRLKMRRARFVRAISRFNRDVLAALCPEEAAKLVVIHTGVDPDLYEVAAGASPRVAAARPRLLCVAALKPYKGLPVLLAACRRLKEGGLDFECDVVGEGPRRRSLERLLTSAGLDGVVRLLGARTQDEVTHLLGAATVFVLPSVVAPDGQMEGIPVSLMEAMAARRPVVATRLSGVPELIEDGVSGILVEPGDPEALAAAVRRLLGDPALARQMGESGRERIEREFRLSACVSALQQQIDAHNPTPSEVAGWLALSTWSGLSGKTVGLRQSSESPDASVAVVLVADGGKARELALKVQRERRGEATPREKARKEFDALAFLHECFSRRGEGLGVPRPLHLDEDRGGLVMELRQGAPLDQLVREGRASRDLERRARLEAAVRRTGEWLRGFQECTAREADPRAALGELCARARGDLAAAAGRGLSSRRRRELGARLGDLAARAPLGSLRVVGRHGDFWPGNISVGGDRVDVIDFEGFDCGLAEDDPAYFLVQLELFFSYPGLRSHLRRLRSAFLEGLGERARPDEELLALCRMASALQILVRSGGEGGAVRRWWRRRALGRILREGRGRRW